jgi:hypothetical protein
LFEPSIGLAGSYMKRGGEDAMITELTPGLLVTCVYLHNFWNPASVK